MEGGKDLKDWYPKGEHANFKRQRDETKRADLARMERSAYDMNYGSA